MAGPDGESTIVPVKVGGRVTAIDPPLPDPVPGTVHIVARVVAAQAPERDDLVWPDDLIRGDRGRVVGRRAPPGRGADGPGDHPAHRRRR